MPQDAAIDPVRLAKLMEGVGRCLAIFQRIEVLLKLMLPYIEDPAQSGVNQPPSQWRSLLDSKQTLGPLIQQFSERMNSENPHGFNDYLKQLVEQRNNLVHHFFNTPIGQVRTNEDLDRAIAHLRGLMQFSTPFLRALEDGTHQFLNALEKSIIADELQESEPG